MTNENTLTLLERSYDAIAYSINLFSIAEKGDQIPDAFIQTGLEVFGELFHDLTIYFDSRGMPDA